MYSRALTLFLCCLLLEVLACKADSVGGQSNTANPAEGGACALLSASDIQAVQGEAVADTHGSERANDALVTSQCFYRLPTFSKSISLDVMRPAGTGDSKRAIKEFWDRRFGQGREGDAEEAESERKIETERGGERKGATREEREREKEEGARPQPVPGLGDEAFWVGSQINASLYIRKNNVIVRLSIGGPEEQSAKIKKARALAEQVLKHL